MSSPTSGLVRDKLQQIGQDLLDEVSKRAPTKKTVAQLVRRIKEESNLEINDLAGLFQVSVQTLYRWMKDEGSVPRKAQIVNFIERLSAESSRLATRNSLETKTRVKIGVSRFWDMALITGFSLAFSSLNVDPEFVPLSSWHDDAHEAFRYKDIDLAIHNHFSELYDSIHPVSSLGLTLSRPLFSYEGHHIFIRREYLDSFKKNQVAQNLTAGLLKEGLAPTRAPEHKELLRKILSEGHIGFERGTDLELAFRRAFRLADVPFPSVGAGNLNCRRSDGSSIGKEDPNPNLVTTEEALDAYLNDEIDMFCGGWQQFYELHDRGEIVLLYPQTLRVKSFNGIVTTEAFAQANPAVLRALEQIWFTGIGGVRKAERGRAYLQAGHERHQTLAELEAILASSFPYTGGMSDTLFSGEDADPLAVEEIKELIGTPKKGAQVDSAIVQALAKHRDRVSAEHERRVFDWAALLCKYDSFYRTPAEAQSAFKSWWDDQEVRKLWEETQNDFVEGTYYGS